MTLRGQQQEHQGQPARGSISAEAASTRSRNALSLNFQGYRKPFLPAKVIFLDLYWIFLFSHQHLEGIILILNSSK